MKFNNIRVFNFQGALRGMRNPKNSWDKSDSSFGFIDATFPEDVDELMKEAVLPWEPFEEEEARVERKKWLYNNGVSFPYLHSNIAEFAFIGPNDLKLAQTLIRGGSEHRKFLRQIFVTVDITAPLYWWKEFDTYKVGTAANSTSTMHKIDSKPITIDDFEIDDYDARLQLIDPIHLGIRVDNFINDLEQLRQLFKQTGDKKYWKELIRWLPESYLQTRTVTMNYENLLSMCHQRDSHKLNEWSGKDDMEKDNFIAFVHSLPYADELIFCPPLNKKTH